MIEKRDQNSVELSQTEQADKDGLIVEVKYKDTLQTFSGSVDSVWLVLNKFFNDLLPSLDIARKITLKIDVQDLIKDCENIVALSKEGPCLLVPRNKLTDNETLSLVLLGAYLAHQLGKAETDSVSKEELQSKLGKDTKITSTRLGELIKTEIAAKRADERYAITIFGLNQIRRDVIPRIRKKL